MDIIILKVRFKTALLFILLFIIYYFIFPLRLKIKNRDSLNYSISKFAIIMRRCTSCGLFSFFITSLGCINYYFNKGYIPIINTKCFPNVLNGYKLNENLWELFFEQPFGFTLDDVLKNAANVEYIRCDSVHPQPRDNILNDKIKINFWHNFAKKFMPIKSNIIVLSNKMMKKLFNNSKNILGVLIRGTDYISIKPRLHPVQPTIDMVISDVKQMDFKNNYDYIIFTTEDEMIREKFTKEFSKKVKQLNSFHINYNYSSANHLNFDKNIFGNIQFNKQYLLNIIILSKCLDLITSRCSGASGILVLTNGFRYLKIYDLGNYK